MATPKARLFQIYPFGKGLTFYTESVLTPPSEDAVPGSTSYFKPNQAVTFRCTLSLPDGSQVISNLFQRKKDAEHDASQRALDKMRVPLAPTPDRLTQEEKWENLRRRFLETFSDKNVLTYLPLKAHFRMAIKRKGPRYGQVSIAVLVSLDAKINTLCKVIDRKTETDPVYAVALLCKASSKCPSMKLDMVNLCISRIEPFSPEVQKELLLREQKQGTECSQGLAQESRDDALSFFAVHIPSSADDAAFSTQIVVQPEEYYLDVLARRIGLEDGCRLIMSRPIGKTHPAMRLYWAIPEHLPNVHGPQSDFIELTGNGTVNNSVDREDLWRYSMKRQGQFNGLTKNVRASLLIGYPIYGDAILAAVGGDWRSEKAYSVDISLSSYSRLLLARFPHGNYKLSRGAVLASSLPLLFSSRVQWRGMSPRRLMIEFCQQHRLPEPAFVLSFPGSETPVTLDLDGKIPGFTEVTELDESCSLKLENGNISSKNDDDNHTAPIPGGPFMCTVRVEFLKGTVTECESEGSYRNRHDAIQSCALKALHQLRPWFESCLSGSYEPVIPNYTASEMDVNLLTKDQDSVEVAVTCSSWQSSDQEQLKVQSAVESSQVDQIPPAGAMVTIRYTVRWFRDGDHSISSSHLLLEEKEEFTFELGSGAVVGELDMVVAEMPVGRTSSFFTSSPALILLFAAADDPGLGINELPGTGKVKYVVQLLKYVEPPEERMEAALFKPSLSKQRLGCALSIIQKLQAKSLIDLGCGSGSLLENLLEEPTGLVELVGVDISAKSLVRAAKLLSTKLMEDQPGKEKLDSIKLYEGSIVEFNRHLLGIDIAVCIEVVEHMDPEPLSKFGSAVLGKLRPRVLIVSTPNFEYNPILQGLDWDPLTNSLRDGTIESIKENRVRSGGDTESSMEKRIRLSEGKDVVADGSSRSKVAQQVVKFRNEDHRFEWTRAEFRYWASTLADEYEYDVTFDGVGGSGEDEGPGFASQIAIFTVIAEIAVHVDPTSFESKLNEESVGDSPHKIVWQWTPVAQQDDV